MYRRFTSVIPFRSQSMSPLDNYCIGSNRNKGRDRGRASGKSRRTSEVSLFKKLSP